MRRNFIRSIAAIAALLCLSNPMGRGADPVAGKDAFRYDGKTFDYWRDYLKTELKAERRIDGIRAMAAFGIKGHGPEAAATVLELMKEYGDTEYPFDGITPTLEQTVVTEAVKALLKIGPPAVDVLVARAKEPKTQTLARRFLVPPLGQPSIPLTARAITALVEAVQGEDAKLTAIATGALNNALQEQKTAVMAAVFKSKDLEKFAQGVIKTAATGDESKSYALLKELWPRVKAVGPSLVKGHLEVNRYRSKEDQLPLPEEESLIPAIADGLKSDEVPIRATAVLWLGRLGPKAAAAAPALIQALNEPDKLVRIHVIRSLGLVAAEPQKSVTALVPILADKTKQHSDRIEAADALTKFGKQAKDAVPALLQIVADEEEDAAIRLSAIETLGVIGAEPREVIPKVVRVVEQDLLVSLVPTTVNNHLVAASLNYLINLGPEAKQATPLLTLAFQTYRDDENWLPAIARTLGQIGPDAKEALPALKEATKSRNVKLQKAATAAIEKITAKEKN